VQAALIEPVGSRDSVSRYTTMISRQDSGVLRVGKAIMATWAAPTDYATLEGFVVQGTGNPLEFTVKILFTPVTGEPYSRTVDYYLACVGAIGSLIARLRTCPLSDIRIDSDNVG
jgi:hypothetical protein